MRGKLGGRKWWGRGIRIKSLGRRDVDESNNKNINKRLRRVEKAAAL